MRTIESKSVPLVEKSFNITNGNVDGYIAEFINDATPEEEATAWHGTWYGQVVYSSYHEKFDAHGVRITVGPAEWVGTIAEVRKYHSGRVVMHPTTAS
jgi:hypothetical protein